MEISRGTICLLAPLLHGSSLDASVRMLRLGRWLIALAALLVQDFGYGRQRTLS